MKFFRQTKETKRKLSFFLALAMVISLLPVTPVAKAVETSKEKVSVTVNNKTTNTKSNPSITTPTTGTAIIELNAADGYIFNNNSITVATSSAAQSSGSYTVTPGATNDNEVAKDNNDSVTVEQNITNNTICKITVKNITANITITIEGSPEKKNVSTESFDVTYSGTIGNGINFSALVGTKEVSTSGTIKVEKDNTITFKVSPSDAKAIWATKPVIKVGDTVLEWKAGSGKNELTATTGKITSNVIISITQGGKVAVIDSAKIDSTTKDTTINTAVKSRKR